MVRGARRAFPPETALETGSPPPLSRSLCLVAGLLLAATPALAQSKEEPREALKRAEQQLKADQARHRQLNQRSESLQKELDELRQRLVALADQERDQGDELDELEQTLAALENEEREQADRLEEERQQIGRLLAALQRLSRIPPEAALARPDAPVDTLRSALLLRDMVPALRARADALASALTQLAGVRERLETQRARTLAARTAIGERRAEMAALVARREELSRQTDEERIQVGREMARLTDQVSDLRQLMERIEAERRAAEAAAKREAERREAERRLAEQKKATAQKEAERKAAERERTETATAQRAPEPPSMTEKGLRLPVGGHIVTRFGSTDRFGAVSRGLTISARPGSAVVSPLAGSIMFAGPFRGYGQILIVEHSNGYHSLIAGLGRIDTAVGKRVAPGEPIALMPTDGTPDLYFELRRHGQPINPQRGTGLPEGKGQG
jgi:septal ring factor EnvC (AmiA/AmiB activator)